MATVAKKRRQSGKPSSNCVSFMNARFRTDQTLSQFFSDRSGLNRLAPLAHLASLRGLTM